MAHVAEHIVVLVKAGGIKKHHLHEAVGVVCKFLQSQGLAEAQHGLERTFEESFLLLGGPIDEALVDEAFGEVHAAQHVLVFDGNHVELGVRPGVLDVGLDQRRARTNGLDQHLLLRNGLVHQRRLLRRQRMLGFVLRFLLRIRRSQAHGQYEKGKGDLAKRHEKLLVKILPIKRSSRSSFLSCSMKRSGQRINVSISNLSFDATTPAGT